jgi:hypothetical protein
LGSPWVAIELFCGFETHFDASGTPATTFNREHSSSIEMKARILELPLGGHVPTVGAALLLTIRPAAGMHFTHSPKL